MYRIRQIYLKVLLLGLAAFAFVACQQDEMQPERGGFSLCLSQFEEVVTRATPAELGKPLASQFKLHIQNTRTDYVMYDGQFQEFVEAYKGNYSIVATYGDNAQLAVDKPYYRGEVQASIDSEGQTTPVNLTCKVANALVSVRFQDTDELKFAEQFSDYYLRVTQGNLYYNLADEAKSVYFRAGGMPKLQFRAVRKTGEEVVLDVESTALPKNAVAAQHFIVTLSMSKTDAQVEPMVSKIAVETVTIFDTVPVEWLPAPKVLSPDVVGFIDNVSVADDM
ncbi:MAG: DUF4493 domain-containing protein, partial [Bacteroidaceae bacterium]|nr:DUF4493 domain-containing protein [Bacteroidaceae bacterium]